MRCARHLPTTFHGRDAASTYQFFHNENCCSLKKRFDLYTVVRYNWKKAMSIRNLKNKGTEDINTGKRSKEALRLLPAWLHHKAQIKFARSGAATSVQDLRKMRANPFEALRGDGKGQYSIRINEPLQGG